MAARKSPPQPLTFDYVRRTRSLPVNVLFLMPFLLVYQVALTFTQSPVDNAAAAWLRALWAALGHRGTVLVTLLVAAALALLVWHRAREATRDRGVYGGMLVEGLCYGALLGTVAHLMATRLPMERVVALAAEVGQSGTALGGLRDEFRLLGLAVGAGIFEEMLFRGVLLAGLYGLLRHALGFSRAISGLLGVAVSAYLFSDYHHWGPTGEPYDPGVFAFRFHAGLLLGAVFLVRGLGIAALAHGFYDVLVMVGQG
ncbi:MAG: CPBP family intramembrane metalloprotease [Planctomycetota bacterium]|nr:CPBP family intramembrane metalloprotease [Planctomycetota bacterium]